MTHKKILLITCYVLLTLGGSYYFLVPPYPLRQEAEMRARKQAALLAQENRDLVLLDQQEKAARIAIKNGDYAKADEIFHAVFNKSKIKT